MLPEAPSSIGPLNPVRQAPKRVSTGPEQSYPGSWAQMDLCLPKIPSSSVVGLFVCGGGTMCSGFSVGQQVWLEFELRSGLLASRFRRLRLRSLPQVANCFEMRWCSECLPQWKASSSLASSSVRCVRAWPARSCIRRGKGLRPAKFQEHMPRLTLHALHGHNHNHPAHWVRFCEFLCQALVLAVLLSADWIGTLHLDRP